MCANYLQSIDKSYYESMNPSKKDDRLQELQIVLNSMKAKLKLQALNTKNNVVADSLKQVVGRLEKAEFLISHPTRAKSAPKKRRQHGTINTFSLQAPWKRESKIKESNSHNSSQIVDSYQTYSFYQPFTRPKENDMSDLWRYKGNGELYFNQFVKKLDLSDGFSEIRQMMRKPSRAQTSEHRRKVHFT